MVRAAGGIGAGQVGEDARLCMGGKVRRGSGGSYGTCCRSLWRGRSSSGGGGQFEAEFQRFLRKVWWPLTKTIKWFTTQQLKSVSEGALNSATSFPPQVKVKKRERSETEPLSVSSLKVEDGDSVSSKLDSVIKGEIAKITDKGGLMNIEAVEKLVQLMQLDKAERKLDLGGARGVAVLDEWLQEAHRGKAGDGSSPKETDRPVEELLLALLRALDKLPVNLNALQTCNVGKSVNQLRSHKNLEIQKKARSLVETWKKRVDAEMTKINDAKSASSWPVKPGFAEVSHGGNRRSGPTELVMKSSITQQSPCKALSSKPGHTEVITKNAVIPGPLKTSAPLPTPVSSTLKDTLVKTSSGVPDVPPATVKEEKSSSSNQSQNNSQSCSGDPMKATGSSWKEDARNLTTGSVISCKTSSSVSRHRRASNGFVGTTTSGTPKDTNLGKPLNRTTTLDKVTQSGLTCERQLDIPAADPGNSSHRLIVRLPNPGRSPARSASGGSFEDPSMTGSRSSPPGAPDKTDHVGSRAKIKDEGVKSNTTIVEEELCRNAEDTGKFADVSRTSLIIIGYRLSVGDDIGINLLASVAAGEMSKSLASPSGSPGSSPMVEDNETKPRFTCDGPVTQSHFQSPDSADVDSVKHDNDDGSLVNRDASCTVCRCFRKKVLIVFFLWSTSLAAAKGVLDGEGTHQHGDEHKAIGGSGRRSCCHRHTALTEQLPSSLAANHSDAVDRSDHISDSSSVQFVNLPGVDDSKAEKSSTLRGNGPLEPVDGERKDQTQLAPVAADVIVPSTLTSKGTEVVFDRKEPAHHSSAELSKFEASSIIPTHENEPDKSSGSKISGPDVDHNEEPVSSADVSLAASAGPDCTSKIDFDLNEGFPGDDGHQSEPVSVPAPVCSSAIHLPSLSHFASRPIPNSSPVPITVASPAKGPFVPLRTY
ncbi:hypothetical protein J5N97_001758 [Dioscorea zingiberensis]|uniref:TFIIS N-terminal domain-containing protein n=1 Tax=Dioscorea zingiberensis TaxID=325984 RepID=A0A9D5BTG2_9LILI|nr:hypothetical protein J5N97_001758 [Dioscorea zingiberensis]